MSHSTAYPYRNNQNSSTCILYYYLSCRRKMEPPPPDQIGTAGLIGPTAIRPAHFVRLLLASAFDQQANGLEGSLVLLRLGSSSETQSTASSPSASPPVSAAAPVPVSTTEPLANTSVPVTPRRPPRELLTPGAPRRLRPERRADHPDEPFPQPRPDDSAADEQLTRLPAANNSLEIHRSRRTDGGEPISQIFRAAKRTQILPTRGARRWTVREDTPAATSIPRPSRRTGSPFFTHTLDELLQDNDEADHNTRVFQERDFRRTTPFHPDEREYAVDQWIEWLEDNGRIGVSGYKLLAWWEENPRWDEELPTAYGWVIPPDMRYSTIEASNKALQDTYALYGEWNTGLDLGEAGYRNVRLQQQSKGTDTGPNRLSNVDYNQSLGTPVRTTIGKTEPAWTNPRHSPVTPPRVSKPTQSMPVTPARQQSSRSPLSSVKSTATVRQDSRNTASAINSMTAYGSNQPANGHVPPRKLPSSHLPKNSPVERKSTSSPSSLPKQHSQKLTVQASSYLGHIAVEPEFAARQNIPSEASHELNDRRMLSERVRIMLEQRARSHSPQPSTPIVDRVIARRRISLPMPRPLVKLAPVSIADFPVRI